MSENIKEHEANLEVVKKRDKMLDQFVKVTQQLDEALLVLNRSFF
jgi:hypothetical protein